MHQLALRVHRVYLAAVAAWSGSVNLTGTAWYVSGTVDIKNACNSDQSLAGTTISFTSQDVNGKPIPGWNAK